jgi:hypothetical protein
MKQAAGYMKNIFKQLEIKNNLFFETAIHGVFLFTAGLVLPVLLIFIVRFTGYSEIVEEIAKAIVVLFLILNFHTLKQKIGAGILLGFLFGLSENFFYLNQIFQLGDFSVFWQRFLWTVPMHIITILVMVFAGLAKKWFLVFGLAGAIILHALFNGIVVNLLM